MPGWLESILIKLFFAMGEYLVAKGKIKVDEWNRVKAFKEKAKIYKEKIKKPDETLEDRLNASDDFMS